MLDAALNGMGLACLAGQTVAPHLEEGRLIRLLENWMPTEPPLYLYYSGRPQIPAKQHFSSISSAEMRKN